MRPDEPTSGSTAVWLRLQARYDLEVAEARMAKRINREVKVLQVAQVEGGQSYENPF